MIVDFENKTKLVLSDFCSLHLVVDRFSSQDYLFLALISYEGELTLNFSIFMTESSVVKSTDSGLLSATFKLVILRLELYNWVGSVANRALY